MPIIEMDDHTISIQIPDGFTQFTEEQIRELGGEPFPNNLTFRDTARHVMLQLMWKRVPFFGRFLSLEKHMEIVASVYKQRIPSYRNQKFLSGTIAGIKAAGFRYDYTVQGQKQCEKYMTMIYRNKFYVFEIIGKKADEAANLRMFDEMLNSAVIHM